MKLAMVIVCLAAIAAGVIHFRTERMHLRHQVQSMETQQVSLRRDLWDQQVRMAWLVAPAEVRKRAQDLALPMVDRAHLPGSPVGPTAGAAPTPSRSRSSSFHD
jgi:hypothetical protein